MTPPAPALHQPTTPVPAAGDAGQPVRFVVPGRPQAWQRTGGSGARRFTRPESAAYKRAVGTVARAAMGRRSPLDGPLRLDVVAVYPRPAKRPKVVPADVWRAGERIVRPVGSDADNVAKAIADALTAARVWHDDAQVVDLHAVTVWAAVGEQPCAEVLVEAVGWHP